jgi:DNA-directed RNA polymerase subunit RPC12/RpoP
MLIVSSVLLIANFVTELTYLLMVAIGMYFIAFIAVIVVYHCPKCGQEISRLSLPEYCSGCGRRFEDMTDIDY